MLLDLARIDKLRTRGLLERGTDGAEYVRISVQQRSRLESPSREAARARVKAWSKMVENEVEPFGGVLVPGSQSVAGQLVEALVPLERIEEAATELEQCGARVDVVEPRQATD